MTVRDVLPNHPVEIMVRTNYPESLLPYLSSERIEQGLLVGYCSWDGDKLIPADGDYYSVDEVISKYEYADTSFHRSAFADASAADKTGSGQPVYRRCRVGAAWKMSVGKAV